MVWKFPCVLITHFVSLVVPGPPSYPLYRHRVQCRSCLHFTDSGLLLPPSVLSVPRACAEVQAEILPSSCSFASLYVNLVHQINREFSLSNSPNIPFQSPSFSSPLLKASFACADTFSSFTLFPHHVCFAAPCSRRKQSSSAPPTFSLPPKFAVRPLSVLSCVFASLLLPLPRDSARNISLTRPQPSVHNSSSQKPSLSTAKLSSHLSIKDGDPHPTKRSRQPSKNQHYLTPPLTPASSLRSDSTDPDSTDLSPPSDGQSPSKSLLSSEAAESRFLIVN